MNDNYVWAGANDPPAFYIYWPTAAGDTHAVVSPVKPGGLIAASDKLPVSGPYTTQSDAQAACWDRGCSCVFRC